MVYAFLRSFFGILTWLLCRYHISGRERIPRSGPVLVVANHLVWYDPALFAVVFPRRLWFMAKVEVFRMPLVALGCRLTGQIPVHRGAGDRAALEMALAYLRKGRSVLIFPEGTVARQEQLLPAHTGVALLALRSGVPILPVAHTGTRRIFVGRNCWRPQVEMQIGQPYTPVVPEGISRKAALQFVTEDLMQRIASMLPPERRGAYTLAAAKPEISRE